MDPFLLLVLLILVVWGKVIRVILKVIPERIADGRFWRRLGGSL
jgi:hypothetical protein